MKRQSPLIIDSAFHRAICDHVPMRPVAEAIASDSHGSAQNTVLAQRIRSIRNQLKATKRSEDNRHAIYYRKWTDTWTRVFTLPVPEHLRKPDDPPQDAAHYDPILVRGHRFGVILTGRRRLE